MKEGLSIGDDYPKNKVSKNIDKTNMSKPQTSKLIKFAISFWLPIKKVFLL